MTIIDHAIGAAFGLSILLPFLRSSVRTLTELGHLMLAAMLMIYVGAHLVSSDLERIILEAVFAVGVLGLSMLFRSRWPVGVGLLVLLHAGYDLLLGHAARVADWYPPVCLGFDVVAGIGLMILITRRQPSAA